MRSEPDIQIDFFARPPKIFYRQHLRNLIQINPDKILSANDLTVKYRGIRTSRIRPGFAQKEAKNA
jgi:hypothetical protein